MLLSLDPRHGPHEPTQGTPQRAPGSVRRTSTTDILRPDGLTGPLILVGRARDLVTTDDFETHTVGTAGYRATVDFGHGRTVTELTTDPSSDTSALVGRSASSGFRRVLSESYAQDREQRSLLFALLDDVPVTTLISGHVLGAERDAAQDYWELRGEHTQAALRNADLCAGWREGGTIMVQVRSEGFGPPVTGPEAPPLVAEDDREGWHEFPALPPSGMRRHRRLDAVMKDGLLHLDGMFRDTYVLPAGVETIIHEYTVAARVDPTTELVVDASSEVHVLPWGECPAAAASATRLAGAPVAGLRSLVRDTFTGTSTCTHLNDALRGLEDAVALQRHLRSAVA